MRGTPLVHPSLFLPYRPRMVRVSHVLILCALVIASFSVIACSNEGGMAAGDHRGIAYTDITEEAGLADFRHITGARGDIWFPETMGSGAGFFDYDVDGDQDIILVGGGTWPPDAPVQALWLYRNDGTGRFTDVSADAGLSDLTAYGMGITAADYDNDGDEDLYFSTVGRNILLRNDGGRFTDVTDEAGVAGEPVWSTSTLFFDADMDGWLDLYVGNYVVWSPEKEIPCPRETGEKAYCTPEMYQGIAGRYYRNQGDGTFSDASHEAGFVPSPGKTLGVVELDFNGDNLPDVAVANDTEADQLFVNQGDGTFDDKGLLAGIAFDEQGKARAGMGIDAGDVDGNGQVSLFVGNFASEMIAVYRYEGEGLFADRAAISRVGTESLATLTFGLFLYDPDLDGDLDVLAANGHIDPDIAKFRDNIAYRQPVHLFLNDGTGHFVDAVPGRDDALSTPLAARGATYADIDGDGDQDVLLVENGGRAWLWRNDVRSGGGGSVNYLRLKLVGTQSNRDALGTGVHVVVGGHRQYRRVRGGGSYLSVFEKPLTIGLGAQTQVDSIIVSWPSGTVEVIEDVAANQTVVIREGEAKSLAEGR